jgi:sec-independent protein translocase protein TatC
MSDDLPDRESLAEGTLISHLLELRSRLLRAVVAIGIAAIPCLVYANQLFQLVAQPLLKALPKGATMISTSVSAPLFTPFKLAIICAAFLAMPYVLYQIWAFVAPGLYRQERRFALPLLVSSVLLFYGGVAFAYFIIFPVMFVFLTAATPAGVQMMTDMTQYLDFVLVMFFVLGLAFEIPVAIVLLVWTGLVRLDTLKRNRGYVLIAICVQAAIITPPDVISLAIIALPMYALYEVGMLMAKILARSKIEEHAREDAEQSEARASR